MTPFIQDPNAVLDYPFDWSTYLAGDTIQTSVFSADSGIMVESDAILDPSNTVVWLSGGVKGKRYAITNHVKTAGAREDDWTIYVLVKER
ncbi:MAG TPA: hypothetical protein VL866_24115 [Pyrinomonadaceae bacterium]|nr:hypothetical protein [Pyrinomonadaceae bacterium]